MKKVAENKAVAKKFPPLEKQKKPLLVKKGDVVKIVVFSAKNEAGIVEMKVKKFVKADVEKTKYGDRQLFDIVLVPVVEGIKIDGRNELVVAEEDPVLQFTDWNAVQNALQSFRYLTKEERLLRAVFGDDNGCEARLRSLVRLAAKVEKATRKEFTECCKEWAETKKEALKEEVAK